MENLQRPLVSLCSFSAKLGADNTPVGTVVVDVCGGKPGTGLPGAIPLLDVTFLHAQERHQDLHLSRQQSVGLAMHIHATAYPILKLNELL